MSVLTMKDFGGSTVPSTRKVELWDTLEGMIGASVLVGINVWNARAWRFCRDNLRSGAGGKVSVSIHPTTDNPKSSSIRPICLLCSRTLARSSKPVNSPQPTNQDNSMP